MLGAGVAGRSLIERIREKQASAKIILIDKDSCYYDKRALVSSLSVRENIEIKSWAESKNVEFIQDKVERVGLRRRKIYFNDRQALEFSVLIVATGLLSRRLSIKGEQREGFFYLSPIKPVALRDRLKISQEVSVYVTTFLGLKIAVALRSGGLEVRIISPNFDFLSDYGPGVIDTLKEKNIFFHFGALVEEAIGEGTVKAVKISPLKVFSSQLICIDSGFLPNRVFFEEEVKIKEDFFTDYEGIYFIGDVNRSDIESEIFFAVNDDEAKVQGDMLAQYLLEGKQPVFQRKIIGYEEQKRLIHDFLYQAKEQVAENI